MPDYYQDHNNVLGSKPRARASAARRANPLVAALILLGCAAIVTALALYGPARGTRGPGPTAYILTECSDGQSFSGTGWFCDPSGRLVTSRRTAFPRGLESPPTRYRIFIGGGSQECSATVADQGSGDDFSAQWAILQISGGPATVAAVALSTTTPQAGQPIGIDGYDTSTAQVALQRLQDTVREVIPGTGFGYGALPDGMDGAPVIDLATGAVLGINLAGQNPGGTAGSGWALPVSAIPALQPAAGN